VRSLHARLTLGFFARAVAAVSLVAITALPGLEKRLVDAKLADLADLSRQYSPSLRRAVGTSLPQSELEDLVRRIADTVGTRVTVLLVVSTNETISVEPGTDSASEREISLEFPVAVDAARTGRAERGTESGPNGPVGEVARPFAFRNPETGKRRVGRVVVFSAPLRDVEASVDVVRRSVLLAGGAASGLALLAGFLVAQGITRRVRSVEAGG
jgi:hypothetical protein